MAIDLSSVPATLETDVDTRAVLKVNGKAYKSWKAISIGRSIAQLAGTFSFTTSNRFAGENAKWDITTGDEVHIEIAGQRVITGYIDGIEDGYDLNTHNVTFKGRDKTADLVDCSYDVFTYDSEFKNQTLLQLIKKLCKPFSINVELDIELLSDSEINKPVSSESIETGEKVYSQIAALCQQYAVLPITFGNGDIIITRAGLFRAFDKLEVGKNIKSNRLIQSDSGRYSVYYTVGGLTPNTFNGKLTADGKAIDKYMDQGRDRSLIILVDKQNTGKDPYKKRAEWEANIRMGASRKVETRVKGWVQSTGDVWPLNGLVSVNDDKIGVKNEFLIAGINLSLDSNGGEISTLSLVHPNTFTLGPIQKKKVTEWDKLKS